MAHYSLNCETGHFGLTGQDIPPKPAGQFQPYTFQTPQTPVDQPLQPVTAPSLVPDSITPAP